MKRTLASLVFFSLLPLAGYAQELSELAQPLHGDNQKQGISQWIGPVKVSIAYHSPRVHLRGADRTGHIWGERVPFGFVDDGRRSAIRGSTPSAGVAAACTGSAGSFHECTARDVCFHMAPVVVHSPEPA